MAETKTARHALDMLSSKFKDETPSTSEILRIGDLAREFNVSLRTLRFYEDRGLISPQRSGSTRLYNQQDRKRLKLILVTKAVGFSLVDIEEMLNTYDQDPSDNEAFNTILSKFENQLEMLKKQQEELDNAVSTLRFATEHLSKVSQP